jgi:hypothetical protein
MPRSALYDDDILLWSEQQAEIVRRLGRRDLPNEFDVENVAEEIESVGRSELAAVKSRIENILTHLIKLALEPESGSARHWRGEILSFHYELLDRSAASVRQRIDIDRLWQLARKRAILMLPEDSKIAEWLPIQSPFLLDDILVEEIDASELAGRLRAVSSGGV